MNFELSFIKFAEYPDDEYRLEVSESKDNKVSLWMENKKTKSQWATELTEDTAKYGPVGIPLPALMYYLQEAFSSLDQVDKKPATAASKASSQSEGSTTTLSAAVAGCSKTMTLTLKVKFSPVWESAYCFKLLAKEVSRADVLEARLRDCEEEIQRQKRINARLLNPRIITLPSPSVDRDSESGNPLPFSIQNISNSTYVNLTFIQSGLYRGFYAGLNTNNYNSRSPYIVQRVTVGTTLTVYYPATIEFIADK